MGTRRVEAGDTSDGAPATALNDSYAGAVTSGSLPSTRMCWHGRHYAVQGIANSATGRTGMTRIVGPAGPVDTLPPNDAIALNSEFT